MNTSAPGSHTSEVELFLRSLGLGRATGGAAAALARAVTPLSVRAGSVLYEAGTPSTWIDYVVRGAIELRAPGHAPWRFGALDTIGVHDLFLDRPRLRTAVAETDVDLFRIRCDDFREVLEDDHDFTRALIASVGTGLFTMSARSSTQAAPAPRSLLDRVTLLQRCPAFARARIQSLVDLAGSLQQATAPRGALVTCERASAPRITLLAVGEAQLEASDGSVPARYSSATLIHGYDSLSEGADRPAARVVQDAVLLHLDEDYLYSVIDDHFDLAWSLLGGIAEERELARDRRTALP